MSANKAANARRQLDETRKRTDSDMNPAWSRAASVVTIDKSVIPLTGTLPALTQQGKPRPVTAFANEHPGANCDFVVGELILHENDNGTSLTRLLEQLGGRLLASSPGSSVHGVDGLGQYHLIGVDVAATGTDPELIGQWLAELDPEARAALRFQNPLALETFAVTAKAAPPASWSV